MCRNTFPSKVSLYIQNDKWYVQSKGKRFVSYLWELTQHIFLKCNYKGNLHFRCLMQMKTSWHVQLKSYIYYVMQDIYNFSPQNKTLSTQPTYWKYSSGLSILCKQISISIKPGWKFQTWVVGVDKFSKVSNEPGAISQITKFMGPTWGPPGSCRPQIGPMLAPWTLLSGMLFYVTYKRVLVSVLETLFNYHKLALDVQFKEFKVRSMFYVCASCINIVMLNLLWPSAITTW